jgi:hypothetical protein
MLNGKAAEGPSGQKDRRVKTGDARDLAANTAAFVVRISPAPFRPDGFFVA